MSGGRRRIGNGAFFKKKCEEEGDERKRPDRKMARILKLYGPSGINGDWSRVRGIDRLDGMMRIILCVWVWVVMEWPRNVPIECAISRMMDDRVVVVSNVT